MAPQGYDALLVQDAEDVQVHQRLHSGWTPPPTPSPTLIIDLRGKIMRSEVEFFDTLYRAIPDMICCGRNWHAWDEVLVYGEYSPTLDAHDLIIIRVDAVGLAAGDSLKRDFERTYARRPAERWGFRKVEVRMEVHPPSSEY